jgi:hypothetical protein
MKTVIDHLTERLAEISASISKDLHQDELEVIVAEIANLLSGLSKIDVLLSETFETLDAKLMKMRLDDIQHQRKINDSLATISTILINYPDVFVKIDPPTIEMFLQNVAEDTLVTALSRLDAEALGKWRRAIEQAASEN